MTASVDIQKKNSTVGATAAGDIDIDGIRVFATGEMNVSIVKKSPPVAKVAPFFQQQPMSTVAPSSQPPKVAPKKEKSLLGKAKKFLTRKGEKAAKVAKKVLCGAVAIGGACVFAFGTYLIMVYFFTPLVIIGIFTWAGMTIYANLHD